MHFNYSDVKYIGFSLLMLRVICQSTFHPKYAHQILVNTVWRSLSLKFIAFDLLYSGVCFAPFHNKRVLCLNFHKNEQRDESIKRIRVIEKSMELKSKKLIEKRRKTWAIIKRSHFPFWLSVSYLIMFFFLILFLRTIFGENLFEFVVKMKIRLVTRVESRIPFSTSQLNIVLVLFKSLTLAYWTNRVMLRYKMERSGRHLNAASPGEWITHKNL